MTRDEIIALLATRDPIGVAAGLPVPGEVRWSRGEPDDDDVEVLRYGAGTTDAQVADRLLEIAAAGDCVRAVHLVPGPDSEDRPGSWGVEDLLVTAVARRVLPDAAIRPDWSTLGAPACQVAVSFGASEWVIPADDDSDPDHLAEAVGARAVAR
jgi:hypothetical protein